MRFERTSVIGPAFFIAKSKISSGSTAFGYPEEVTVLIDESLGDYDVVWAAGGHPHAVFATTYEDLFRASGATSLKVAND